MFSLLALTSSVIVLGPFLCRGTLGTGLVRNEDMQFDSTPVITEKSDPNWQSYRPCSCSSDWIFLAYQWPVVSAPTGVSSQPPS